MFRLACGLATLAVLGLIPMATAAMFVALLGVGLGSLALWQLNQKADEVVKKGEQNRRMLSAGADRSRDG
jgi:hypothetical protein